MRTPTDHDLLNVIYDRYYSDYIAYDEKNPSRSSKIYVPIDIESIANEFQIDSDIVFGRLYYDLNKRYGYKQDDGSRVDFFGMVIGGNHHCIHFPYLASVLAGLRDESRKYRLATGIAITSLFLSVISLGLSIFL